MAPRFAAAISFSVVFGSAAVALATPPAIPAGLTVTAVTRSGFSASWSGTSSAFRAIYKPGALPASPTDGTLITDSTSTSASVTGLAPNTRYFVAVYGEESGTYSTSADSTSLITG